MNDLTAMRQHRRLDQFVILIDGERLGFLVDQRFNERKQVLRVQQRGRCCDPARYVQMPDNRDAIDFNDLAGNRALYIAAPFNGKIDDN